MNFNDQKMLNGYGPEVRKRTVPMTQIGNVAGTAAYYTKEDRDT